MKKRMDIERLLKWAYCEELPKAGAGSGSGSSCASSWLAVETFGQLLANIDDNAYGVVPNFGPLDGDPHPDAVKVHVAVCDLNAMEVDFPSDWNPMPEIAEHPKHSAIALDAARFGIANARRRPVDLVRRHAILGGCPETEGQVPKLVPVRNREGQPIWFRKRVVETLDEHGNPREYSHEGEDGWCRVRKAPKRGAYQKFYFDPDPVPVIIARGEYQIWRCALSMLTDALRGMLESVELSDTARPVCPWEGAEGANAGRQPRILRDLRFSA